MSYCATTILVWGVRLDSNQAQKVYNYLQETDDLFQSDGEISINVDDLLRESPVGRGFGRRRYYPNMYSEGADSRIHDNFYEEGYSHVLGLYVASNGYAYSDSLEDFMTPNMKYASNYDKYIKPLLDGAGVAIFSDPKMLITNQVW